MAQKYKNVVVAGGSISGLMAALTLTRAGCEVTVLEALPEAGFKDQGAGLGMRAEVLAFLEEYLSPNAKLDKFAASDSFVLNQDGSLAAQLPWPPGMFSTKWGSLNTALRQSLKKDTIFGAKVDGIAETHGKLVVDYQMNGRSHKIENVDLVVGADGANSTLRKLMGINPQRVYAGYAFWRGSFEIADLSSAWAQEFLDNKNFMSVNGNTNIILYRITPDRGMWGIYRKSTPEELKKILTDVDGKEHSYSLAPGRMKPENLALIKEWSQQHFCPAVQECTSSSTDSILQVITECFSTENTFMDGRVVLVGEANALLRPHITGGLVTARYHALRLRDLAEGTIDASEYRDNTMAFSRMMHEASCELGSIWMDGKFGDLETVLESRKALGRMGEKAKEIESSLKTQNAVKT